jgi:hypothetical protein
VIVQLQWKIVKNRLRLFWVHGIYFQEKGAQVMAEEEKRAAVYVSWSTFKNSLDQLAKGMPSRIDRSVFPGLAWNVQSQLFAGLKFLGLVTPEDEPTLVLSDLVKGSEEERKAKLRKLIESRYAELIAIDLTKATRAHFEEELGRLYAVTGDTRGKAARFFLNAASYVGIPLSSFIAPSKDGSSAVRRPRASGARRSRKNGNSASKGNQHDTDLRPSSGTSKSVSLKSGGVLTLSATLDLFALNSEDRKFVFELIDKLDGYEEEEKEK